MDARTGQVLWEDNADTRLHPASLTKMMTLYIAFDAARRGEVSMDDMVTISRHAAAEPPSRLGLRSGQRIALRHLVRAAAIKSANDAASAIGEHISGSEAAFAQRMNRTAKALGMSRTSFRNAHGLTAEGHMSTARDMTLLGRRLFYDFPDYYSMFSRLTEDAGIARVSNTNRRFLEAYRGADGIKTGYTQAAGFNLTASAQRGNKRLIATYMGGTSTAQRNQRISQLLDIGFNNAPSNARTTPPRPVQLDQVASAPAAGNRNEVSAGKTIRLPVARTTSPRPERRPSSIEQPPPEVLAEVASGVADILAGLSEVTEVKPAEAPSAPFAMAAASPEAPAESAPSFPDAFTRTGPQPRPTHLAELHKLTPADEAPPPEVQLAQAEAPATAAPEAPLPFAVVDAAAPAQEVATQTAAAAQAPAETPAPPVQLADATPPPEAAPQVDPASLTSALAAAVEMAVQSEIAALDQAALPFAVAQADPEAALAEDMPMPQDDDADMIPEDLRLAGKLIVPETAPQPRAQQGEIVLTMASNDPPSPSQIQSVASRDEAREVVTRISTSGGRHWAITLGKFPSRGTAERALMQTALSETRTLEGGLRKINQRANGWEATFAGLTRDQADLACRRLQARAISCFTLGP